jgi:hypothetical protein
MWPMRAGKMRLVASVGATDAGWQAGHEQAADVTDARKSADIEAALLSNSGHVPSAHTPTTP